MGNAALTQAERYHDAGLAIVPALHGSKECKLTDWQSRRLSKDELPLHFNGSAQNFAVACGALSGGICVVDCDWPEAAAFAQYLLPHTPAYGRDSDPLSHYLVRCPGIPTTKHQFAIPDRRRMVVEILSDKHQCLLPGSQHPSGEPVTFATNRRLSNVAVAEMVPADLQTWVSRIAAGAVLLYHWPTFEGTRHDLTLALAGACLHSGWSVDDVAKFFRGFFKAANDSETKDRIAAVKGTLLRFTAGECVTGWPRAAEVLGDLAPFICETLQLQINATDQLTFGGKPLSLAQPVVGTSWPELMPFDCGAEPSNTDYPLAALGALAAPVEALADMQQVPIALAAQAVLTALSTAAQGLYDVAVDRHQRSPISLWMVLIAAPGERKTSTHDRVLVPHRDWQTKAVQRYKVAMEAYKAGTESVSKPRMPILLPSAGTTEGLLKTLAASWPSAGFINSDAGDWLHGYSMREGRGTATLAALSRLWDGTWDISCKAGDEPQLLFGRRLTLSLMIQPEVVGGMLGRQFIGQGFSSRLLISYPGSRIGFRPFKRHDETPPALAAFENAIRQLLDSELLIDPHTGAITTTALSLDAPALAEFERQFNILESSLAPGGCNQAIADVVNKAPNQLLRLAANLALYRNRITITADEIVQASQLLNFYLEEWRSVSDNVAAADPEQMAAQQLLGWLRNHVAENPGPFKLRTLYQRGPRSGGRTADAVKKVLLELMRRGYVRPVTGNQYELRPEAVE